MKKTAAIAYVLMSLVFAGIGAWGGWTYSQKLAPAAAHADEHDDHDEADGGDHEGHDHAAHADEPEGLVFSDAALLNMGVRVEEIEERDYAITEALPAIVVETQQTEQPVIAPVGGYVKSISPRIGQQVEAGEVVAVIIRDALPRPELGLTEEMLQPASEEFHATKAELRQALKSQEVLQQELDRLTALNTGTPGDLPLIPAQELINLRYEGAKLEQEVANHRLELRLHGVTDDQIKQIEAGQELDLRLRVWRAVLDRNGFWSDEADVLLGLMPEQARTRPWVIATIAELVTQDLLTDELMAWMKESPEDRRYMQPIAGMLMQGESLVAIRRLAAIGALEPEVSVRVPTAVPDWDVHGVHVKAGDHVDAGELLLTLANAREVYLDTYPVGGEVTAMRGALESQARITAVPLVDGSGPVLEDLTVQRLGGGEEDRPLARLVVRNQPLQTTRNADGTSFRSWTLRPGLRYMLRIPTRQLESVLVINADAVVDNGADKIVYVQNGEAFEPRSVQVVYADHRDAVLGPASDLFPGDPVVVSGAFALNLAQRAQSGGAIDPHAGHNH